MEKSFVMVKPGFANNKKVVDYIKERLTNIGLSIVSGEYKFYSKGKAIL